MVNSKQLIIEYKKQFGKTYTQMNCISSITNILNRYGGRRADAGTDWRTMRMLRAIK